MVADGKRDRKGELELMRVMLVDPSLPAGSVEYHRDYPPTPPLLINMEPHIHHVEALSYSCGHVGAGSADKTPKQRHTSVL